MTLIRIAFVAYLLVLTVLLLAPDPNALTGMPELPGFFQEYLTHFLLLAGLTVLAQASRWPLGSATLLGLLAVYAAATEALQAFSPPRQVDAKDLVENLLGIAAGAAFWWAAVRWRSRGQQA